MKRLYAYPSGVSRFKDRHGKTRVRGRKRGLPTHYFKADYGTAEFTTEYEAWCGRQPFPEKAFPSVVRGSISDVIERYYRSPTWAALAKGSKDSRRNILERLREKYGQFQIVSVDRNIVQRILAKKVATPQAAKNLLKMLRALMRVALDAGLRKDDPTIGVRVPTRKTEGFHTWTEAEIETYEAKFPVGTRERLAFDVLLYTGQRRSDVVSMGRQHIQGGRLSIKQQKTGTTLLIQILPELQRSLDAACQGKMTFLLTAQNKPFTAPGFGNWFRDCVAKAGLPKECSAHGLRKAAARRLAEAGCTAPQIAAVTGHRSLSEVQRYIEAASQTQMADAAFATLRSNQSGTKLG